MTATTPGWHPCPTGAETYRWWDGLKWTAYTSDSRAAPAPDGPAPVKHEPLATPEDRRVAAARRNAPPVLQPRLQTEAPKIREPKLRPLLASLKPKRPNWAKFSNRVGWLMVAGSVVALGLVVYENGLTGAPGRSAQNVLSADFTDAISDAGNSPQVTSALVFPGGEALSGERAPAEMAQYGQPAARLIIPKLGTDLVVGVGTDDDQLRRGPGLWVDGVTPGSPGNATIVGHRSTYGSPFRSINELVLGDEIVVELPNRPPATFEVRESQIVAPTEVGVTAQTQGARLTLITCDPPGSTGRRLVVQAELVEGEFDDVALDSASWVFQR